MLAKIALMLFDVVAALVGEAGCAHQMTLMISLLRSEPAVDRDRAYQ